MHTAAGVITCAAGSGRRLEPPGRVPAPRQEQGPVGTISSGPVARELVRRSLARGDQAVARSKGRSGQRRDPLARSQRKWAETGRRVGPQTGPSPPRKPCKQAKLRASERLDRTQEAAGSSPASSTRRTPAVERFSRFRVAENTRVAANLWPDLRPDRTIEVGVISGVDALFTRFSSVGRGPIQATY
jgi:hypothetical protein